MSGFIKETKLRSGAHVLFEQESYSRSNETVSGGSYAVATVMGKVTATGKTVQVNASANDGSETAVSILWRDVDASVSDQPGVVNDAHTVVKRDLLVWPAGATDPQKAAWEGQLKAAGVKLR